MKKTLSFILSLLMVISVITSMPLFVNAATTPTLVSSDTAYNRIYKLYDILGGSYFNTTQSTSCGTKSSGHSCSYCKLSSIITQSWFVNRFGSLSVSQFPITYYSDGSSHGPNGWSCFAFASFAEWYIYRTASTDKVTTEYIGTFSYDYSTVASTVQIGDLIRVGDSHSAIAISYDSTGVTVLDSNWSGSYNCQVNIHTIKYTSYSSFSISRAQNASNKNTSQTYTPPQIVKSASIVNLKFGETESASVDVSFQNGTYPNACELDWKINNSSIAITNGGVVVASTYGSGTIFIDAIGIGTTSIDVYITDKVTGQIIATDYITVNVSAKTCNILYNANGGSGTMSGSTVSYLSEFSLKPNTFTKTGYSFVGWNVYRNSDGKWFVEGPGWQTDEEIASNSYTKKVYQASVTMTFNDSWFTQLDSLNATDTFTFYAVWQPNHICVYRGTVTKPATCTENGVETFICSCGDSYTQEISATGHSYASDWIVDLEPTCTEEGSKSKTCSVCQSVTTETLETLGHDYSTDWIIDKSASCTETGIKSHHCSRCESTINITVIEATGHTESDWIVNEEANSQHKECIICGEMVETQIIGVSHTVSSWQTTIEATVYSAGEKVGVCTECGATVVEEIPQLKCSKPTLENVRNATNGVRIVWSKVKGGDSYNIYRRTKSGSYRLIGTTEKSYFDDESAVSGKRYYYSVKAVNEAGESTYSSADSIYHLATPTLTKICNATGGLKITWSKVSGAEGYYIYRKLYGAEEWTKIATIKDNSTVSYKDTKVSEGKVYVYTVKAFDGKRKSSIDSDGIWLRYLKKPTLKTISNTGNGVKITWDEIRRAEKYNVYRRVSNSEYKCIGSTTNTYYTDKTAKSGKKYYYTIRAQKGETVSYISNTLSKYYLEDPTLNTPSSTKSGVKLSWSEVTGAQGYIIYRKTGSGSYTKLKTEKGVTNLSYVDTSAKKGTKYTYKVKAYYSKTYSAYSDTKSVTAKY